MDDRITEVESLQDSEGNWSYTFTLGLKDKLEILFHINIYPKYKEKSNWFCMITLAGSVVYGNKDILPKAFIDQLKDDINEIYETNM